MGTNDKCHQIPSKINITKRSKGRTSNAALTQKLVEDDLLAEAKRVERGRKPLLALRPRKPFGRAGALEGGHGAGAKEATGFEAFKETMDGSEQVAKALSLHQTMDSRRRETPRIENGVWVRIANWSQKLVRLNGADRNADVNSLIVSSRRRASQS